MEPAAGVVRRPPGRILKQPNRADAAVGAQIEPVARAVRNADEIPAFDFDGEDRAARRADVKQPTSLDDEADLVFVVPVLAAELGEHDVEARRVGSYVDDVGSGVS